MRNLIVLLVLVFLNSCNARKVVKQKEYIHDTIRVEVVRDSIIEKEKEVIVTKPIKTEVFIPCPEDTEIGSSGEISSGNNTAQWQFDEMKNGYKITFECDSAVNELNREIIRLKNENKSIRTTIQGSELETNEVKNNFWQGVLSNLWKILFFITAGLWLFGITPKFIFKLLKSSLF